MLAPLLHVPTQLLCQTGMTNIWRFTQQNPATRPYIFTTQAQTAAAKPSQCAGGARRVPGSSRLHWPSSPEQCQQHYGQKGLLRILLIASPHRKMGGEEKDVCHTYRVPQGDPRPSVSLSQPRPLLWLHFSFSRSFLFLIREKQNLRAFELHNSLCKRGTERDRHDLERSVSPALPCQSKGPAPHPTLCPAPSRLS